MPGIKLNDDASDWIRLRRAISRLQLLTLFEGLALA